MRTPPTPTASIPPPRRGATALSAPWGYCTPRPRAPAEARRARAQRALGISPPEPVRLAHQQIAVSRRVPAQRVIELGERRVALDRRRLDRKSVVSGKECRSRWTADP